MKWKLAIPLLLAGLIVTGCQSSPQAESTGDVTATQPAMQTSGPRAVLTIEGMACPFCTYNIQRQLERVDGVEQAHVSLEKGEAYVTLSESSPASAEQLRKAVESAGFTPTEVRMP